MKGLPYIIFILFLSILFGCNKHADTEMSDADKLYNESKALLISHIKIMKNLPDSVDVDSISKVFEDKLTKINFSVAPGTDALLTEDRNDTLAMLTSRYVALRNKRMGHSPADNDSTLLTNK